MRLQKDMKTKFDNSRAYYNIDTRIFSVEVIQKCFYWFTGDYLVDYEFQGDHYLQVTLSPLVDNQIDQMTLTARVSQDLNDFFLREKVAEQTRTIRELIVAKAFANFEEEEDFSMESVSDPLGFKL